jgi:hypothetical protein
MATIISRLGNLFKPERVKPTVEQGVAGFAVYGGYVTEQFEDPNLFGWRRWKTAADMLAQISVIAASVRFMSNLISRPTWAWDPADDSPAAREAAEFMQSVIEGMDVSWTRVVRRSVMYKFHGFMVQEWIAERRPDGLIGLRSIEPRPQKTITKWDVDDSGQIKGVVQTDPQTGKEIYLPRGKLLYLVDDSISDRPDGMGWFHHLYEPAEHFKSLLDLEKIGFERDLRGIPIGRAPFSEINKMVRDGKMTQQQADAMINDLRDFVAIQRKSNETGMVFDSMPYESISETGKSITSVMKWGVDLLSGEPQSVEEMGAAIKRLQFEMAVIMGTENLMTGRDGEGSRALSEDKSRNLYLTANSILWDIAEAVERDIRDVIWKLNGLPDELKPKANVEDVSFKDAQQIATVLNDMASAGAILAPDDPAIDDLRALLGISLSKPMDPGMAAAMQGEPQVEGDEEALGDPEGGTGGARKRAWSSFYARRNLTPASAAEFVAWAKSQGFATTVPPEQLHVTLAYSKTPVYDVHPLQDPITSTTGPREVAALGDGGAVVLKFRSKPLHDRWQALLDAGATFNYPSFTPHVTISWDAGDVDLSQVEPFTGELEFGPEVFEEIGDDWKDNLVEKYNPNQPRNPAGQAGGGRWTSGGGGGSTEAEEQGESEAEGKGDGEVRRLGPSDKDRIVDALKGKTVEEMVAMGETNQNELRAVGSKLESELGLTFVDPGPKSETRVREKLRDEGYEGPHQITDYSRSTFVVNSPQEADAVVSALAKDNVVYDKGWTQLKGTNYLDRKLYIQHDNGGLSEVQLVPRGIAIYKGGPGMPRSQSTLSGIGHTLYEISRQPSVPQPVRERVTRLQSKLYTRALQGTAFLSVIEGGMPPGIGG